MINQHSGLMGYMLVLIESIRYSRVLLYFKKISSKNCWTFFFVWTFKSERVTHKLIKRHCHRNCDWPSNRPKGTCINDVIKMGVDDNLDKEVLWGLQLKLDGSFCCPKWSSVGSGWSEGVGYGVEVPVFQCRVSRSLTSNAFKTWFSNSHRKNNINTCSK